MKNWIVNLWRKFETALGRCAECIFGEDGHEGEVQ